MRSASLLLVIASVALAACNESPPGTLACGAPLDAYCSPSAPANCTRDFSTATASCLALRERVSTAPCGGYDFVTDLGVDTSETRWYDHASGKLVAITGRSIRGQDCIAGPADFAVPTCESSTAYRTCDDDAGADGPD